MASVQQKTLTQLAKDLVSDFLTVAIHSLLHSRNVYPAGAFKLRQKFHTPVQICYHPDVFSYITSIIESLTDILNHAKLYRVHIFIGSESSGWEQFTFSFDFLSNVTTQEQLNDLQYGLKCCLLKLSIVDSYLASRADSDDITWRVEVDTNDKRVDQSSVWVRVDEDKENKAASFTLVPLKTLATDVIKLELYAKAL